jgi:hypothetical protein
VLDRTQEVPTPRKVRVSGLDKVRSATDTGLDQQEFIGHEPPQLRQQGHPVDVNAIARPKPNGGRTPPRGIAGGRKTVLPVGLLVLSFRTDSTAVASSEAMFVWSREGLRADMKRSGPDSTGQSDIARTGAYQV